LTIGYFIDDHNFCGKLQKYLAEIKILYSLMELKKIIDFVVINFCRLLVLNVDYSYFLFLEIK
jgi:hypothetical protein